MVLAITGTEGTVMILAPTTVEDVYRFLEVFGTRGAAKRALAKPQSASFLAAFGASGRGR